MGSPCAECLELVHSWARLPSRRTATIMSCRNCVQTTLSLFIRSFTKKEPALVSQRTAIRTAQPLRLHSTAARQPFIARKSAPLPPKADTEEIIVDDDEMSTEPERPSWQLQKAALKEKLGGQAWNPRKKLSPDTMEGIRHLHSSQPDRFTTPILAQHFKVSPEAIRRILKSKWQPSDEESEARAQRWQKRGERIWTNLVEMGVKPPKKWRQMGVGRATGGERPKWKSRQRNTVHVQDSASTKFPVAAVADEDIIPIVRASGKASPAASTSLAQRL
jgi:hypothetical protein